MFAICSCLDNLKFEMRGHVERKKELDFILLYVKLVYVNIQGKYVMTKVISLRVRKIGKPNYNNVKMDYKTSDRLYTDIFNNILKNIS